MTKYMKLALLFAIVASPCFVDAMGRRERSRYGTGGVGGTTAPRSVTTAKDATGRRVRAPIGATVSDNREEETLQSLLSSLKSNPANFNKNTPKVTAIILQNGIDDTAGATAALTLGATGNVKTSDEIFDYIQEARKHVQGNVVKRGLLQDLLVAARDNKKGPDAGKGLHDMFTGITEKNEQYLVYDWYAEFGVAVSGKVISYDGRWCNVTRKGEPHSQVSKAFSDASENENFVEKRKDGIDKWNLANRSAEMRWLIEKAGIDFEGLTTFQRYDDDVATFAKEGAKALGSDRTSKSAVEFKKFLRALQFNMKDGKGNSIGRAPYLQRTKSSENRNDVTGVFNQFGVSTQ